MPVSARRTVRNGRPVMPQSADSIVDAVLKMRVDSRIQVLAPLIKDRKGHHQTVFDDVRRSGFVRVRVDGELYQNRRQKSNWIATKIIPLKLSSIDLFCVRPTIRKSNRPTARASLTHRNGAETR